MTDASRKMHFKETWKKKNYLGKNHTDFKIQFKHSIERRQENIKPEGKQRKDI